MPGGCHTAFIELCNAIAFSEVAKLFLLSLGSDSPCLVSIRRGSIY